MKNQLGYTLFELIAVVACLCVISVVGFLLYGVVHFILKLW